MKQADIKAVLMQSQEFSKAYMDLKELVRESKYWYVDNLEFYLDIIPVIYRPEYKVKYGEFWLMFAELMFPENFPKLKTYGFVIVEMEE